MRCADGDIRPSVRPETPDKDIRCWRKGSGMLIPMFSFFFQQLIGQKICHFLHPIWILFWGRSNIVFLYWSVGPSTSPRSWLHTARSGPMKSCPPSPPPPEKPMSKPLNLTTGAPSRCHDHLAKLNSINPPRGDREQAERSGEIWIAGISGTWAKMSTW